MTRYCIKKRKNAGGLEREDREMVGRRKEKIRARNREVYKGKEGEMVGRWNEKIRTRNREV